MTEKVFGAIARAEALAAGHPQWWEITQWPIEEESMETNATKIRVFQGADDQWYWHAQADNNEVVAQSEGYESHQGAKNAAWETFPGVPVLDGENVKVDGA